MEISFKQNIVKNAINTKKEINNSSLSENESDNKEKNHTTRDRILLGLALAASVAFSAIQANSKNNTSKPIIDVAKLKKVNGVGYLNGKLFSGTAQVKQTNVGTVLIEYSNGLMKKSTCIGARPYLKKFKYNSDGKLVRTISYNQDKCNIYYISNGKCIKKNSKTLSKLQSLEKKVNQDNVASFLENVGSYFDDEGAQQKLFDSIVGSKYQENAISTTNNDKRKKSRFDSKYISNVLSQIFGRQIKIDSKGINLKV